MKSVDCELKSSEINKKIKELLPASEEKKEIANKVFDDWLPKGSQSPEENFKLLILTLLTEGVKSLIDESSKDFQPTSGHKRRKISDRKKQREVMIDFMRTMISQYDFRSQEIQKTRNMHTLLINIQKSAQLLQRLLPHPDSGLVSSLITLESKLSGDQKSVSSNFLPKSLSISSASSSLFASSDSVDQQDVKQQGSSGDDEALLLLNHHKKTILIYLGKCFEKGSEPEFFKGLSHLINEIVNCNKIEDLMGLLSIMLDQNRFGQHCDLGLLADLKAFFQTQNQEIASALSQYQQYMLKSSVRGC